MNNVSNIQKKYFFAAHFPDEKNYCHQICCEFLYHAFATPSVLFVLLESEDLAEKYMSTYRLVASNYSTRIITLTPNNCDVESLIKSVDCYIAGDNPDELPYIECAWKNHIKIVSFIRDGKNIFRDFPISESVNKLKLSMKNAIDINFLRKFPFDEWQYILFHNGMGESTIFFFLMKEYKRQIGKKLLLLCFHNARMELMQNCPYVDCVIKIPPELFDYMSIFTARYYPIKNFLKIHVLPYSIKMRESFPPFIYYVDGNNYFLTFLDMNPCTAFERYSVDIPIEKLESAKKIFNEMNLQPKKTIFLSVQGIMFREMVNSNAKFFFQLAKTFQAIGFDVVTNSQNEIFPGIRNVFLSFWENVAFIGLCGNVISVPTGFIEASCSFNEVDDINFHVIYPNKYDSCNKPSKELMKQIQLYGDDFTNFQAKAYQISWENRSTPNVKMKIHFSPTNDFEIQKLIKKLVKDIAGYNLIEKPINEVM